MRDHFRYSCRDKWPETKACFAVVFVGLLLLNSLATSVHPSNNILGSCHFLWQNQLNYLTKQKVTVGFLLLTNWCVVLSFPLLLHYYHLTLQWKIDCFSWCLAAQGVDDSDPWDEVLAPCPTKVIGCGTKVPLVLAAPNTWFGEDTKFSCKW